MAKPYSAAEIEYEINYRPVTEDNVYPPGSKWVPLRRHPCLGCFIRFISWFLLIEYVHENSDVVREYDGRGELPEPPPFDARKKFD